MFIDGTHIKANANKKKTEKITVTKPVKQYQEESDKEIEADRKQHGKKPLKRDEIDNENGNSKPTTEKTLSKTDPDSDFL